MLCLKILPHSASKIGYNNSNDIFQNSLLIYLKNLDYDAAFDYAENEKNLELRQELIQLSQVLHNAGQYKTKFLKEKVGSTQLISAISLLRVGYYHLYKNPYSKKPFENFNKAYEVASEIDNDELKKFCLISILEVYNFEIAQSNEDALRYLNKLKISVSDIADEYHYRMHLLHFSLRDIFHNVNIDEAFFEKFDTVMSTFGGNHNFWANYYSSKGVFFEHSSDYTIAVELYKKAINKINEEPFLKYIKFRSLIRLSEIKRKQNVYAEALEYINEAKNYKDLSDSIRSNYYLNYYSSLNLFELEKYEEAFNNLKIANDLKERLDYQKNTLEIAHLNMRYKTQEKEIALIKAKEKERRSQNLLIGSVILLFSISTIAFLIHKSTKRKQLLAEQEKIVQEQKVENLLKEQELTTIDAMIEGQEKERIRIANDLHDDLGGLMANVKLHFNSLQEKSKEEDTDLYNKTDKLLDEAYEKIRAIAHAKNSGVIAKQGLLKAVHEMADKISTANKLNIEVVDHGLNNRLENSLELALFRMIQELVTNIIKHANATEAAIHLTNHEDVLNIMVEDNGKGFKPQSFTSRSKGMGLKNIDKRIAHLNGTLDIESKPGNGTTIIVDIPI